MSYLVKIITSYEAQRKTLTPGDRDMLETLKSMLLDFQEMTLETGVPRRLEVQAVPGKATVCVGVRRSGKGPGAGRQNRR